MLKSSFCSWSGGKDSCLSLYKAINQGYDVRFLLTMMSDIGNISRSHGISSKLLFDQSKSLEIKMIQKNSSWENYEDVFISALREIKQDIEYGVFGDIDTQEHLNWVNKVCKINNIQYFEPLWKYNRLDVIKEFLDSGFKAIIVSCDGIKLGEKYLGKEITFELMNEFSSIGIDPAGENGEYHTFVYDGPIFKNKIEFTQKEIKKNNNYLFLEIE